MNRDQADYLWTLGFEPSPFGWPKSVASPAQRPIDLGDMPSWDGLKEKALACKSCSLSASREQVVFGSGDRSAKLMFLGEAPAADDDKSGQPFSGSAGQLLAKMIEAMGLSREQVYLAHAVQCRPPQNRNPSADEIATCSQFVRDQIRLVQPKVLVTLGTIASQAILKTQSPMSEIRGRLVTNSDFGFPLNVMPTHHPAYLLRNPDLKKLVWGDLKLVMGQLASITRRGVGVEQI